MASERPPIDIQGSSATAQMQSEKDLKTVRMVQKLFSQAKMTKQLLNERIVDNYLFFRGKQWNERRPTYRHQEVINLAHTVIQQQLPILTDPRPNIETVPEEPSDFLFSEFMTQILRSKWDRNQHSKQLSESLVDNFYAGTAIGKITWNPELLNGLGDYEWKVVDPLYFYPDKNATDVNDNFGQYVIEAEPLDVDEIKRRYPKKGHLVKGDLSEADMQRFKKSVMNDQRIRSPVDNRTFMDIGDFEKDFEGVGQALLIECWMSSDELIEQEIEKMDDKGNLTKAFQVVKKYPRGRKIVIASGILLEDMPNPYDDGKFPYARLRDYILPREFWGEGEIDQIKGPNRLLNKTISYMMDILSQCGNPIWKVPAGSGIDVEKLINSPGLVVEYNDGAEPRREPGVQAQPFILQIFDRMEAIVEKISGVNEVSQGAAPTSTSGVAIEQLQEAAQTRLRQKARNLNEFLKDIGKLITSRILQFYTEPRVERMVGTDEANQFFRFHIDEQDSESGPLKVAVMQEVQAQPDGSMVAGEPVVLEIKDNLDLRIDTGTELPLRKARRKADAKELFQAGIIDEEDLLEAMDWPNKERTLNKLQERKAQEAEMLAQQQAAEAGALPPEGAPPLQPIA
jgi:hypothetical protein